MSLRQLYNDFVKSYKTANPQLKHADCDKYVSEIWHKLKQEDDFVAKVQGHIQHWNAAKTISKQSNLVNFWSRTRIKASEPHSTESTPPARPAPIAATPNDAGESGVVEAAKKTSTPVQDSIRKTISTLESDIEYLQNQKEQGLASEDQLAYLIQAKQTLKDEQSKLKVKEQGQARQQKKRKSDKKLLEDLKVVNPDVARILSKRPRPGRPPAIEAKQPELLSVDMATYGADERRRWENIRTIQTMDELTEELKAQGLNMERNCETREGKRHVSTVLNAQSRNDLHKCMHSDTLFCKASIRYLEELASVLGPNQVLFLSQDDKARVAIGKTAANKQTPLLMHLEYRVRLPDHDWVVAEKHKLIPSVYGIMEVAPGRMGNPKAVGYSGPAYITVRSGKHCSSTAYSHGMDFENLMNCSELAGHCKFTHGGYKPIVIITVDGGPDENPRYAKTIACAIDHFKMYDLDALFLATNAPGRSAFDRVERQMAPLSRDLAGVILEHDHFGTHLNDRGQTIDKDLEKENFEHAGKILASIWSNTVIDGHPTIASYVDPEFNELTEVDEVTESWKTNHVREGHYFLQVVKCADRSCCTEPRSSYFKFIKRFIPSPLCVSQNDGHEIKKNLDEVDGSDFLPLFMRLAMNDNDLRRGSCDEVPFDTCCPSLKDIIDERCCGNCGIYHGTMRSMTSHKRECLPTCVSQPGLDEIKAIQGRVRPLRVAAKRQKELMVVWTSRLNDQHVDWFDEDEVEHVGDIPEIPEDENETVPLINMDLYMRNPWEPGN